MTAVLRTRTIDETRGFMKALIDANGDHILGFTMIGPEAGEVMAVVEMAMLAGLPHTALRDAILTHPTMAEGLKALFSRVEQPGVSTVSLRRTPVTLSQDNGSTAPGPQTSEHRA
jgi:Pyridine nucleotide-disulphide oxidoreductase, dimerisation domain